MTLEQRIALLVQLGKYLVSGDEYLHAVLHRTQYNNGWLTVENYNKAAKTIAQNYLQKEQLNNWAKQYDLKDKPEFKKIGIVMADNIPFVGFHDLLAIFLSGNQAIIKLSDRDKFVIPHLIKKMGDWNKASITFFEIAERLKEFEGVITTGSNGPTRYFKQYFEKYPNIIRENKYTVAVLDGTETKADLYALGNDVFEYFGLASRSVSKIYIPRSFKFEPLLESFHEYNGIILNSKYKNNFDYNYSMYLLNKVVYKANGCIILIEAEAINSRIASLHYEFYDNADTLKETLAYRSKEIQGVVTKMDLPNFKTITFGKAHQPSLIDYADSVDTMEFLINL